MEYKKYLFRSLPSTNDFAKNIAKQGSPEGTVILAENQTAGKGRLGRNFFSPENTGIYLSLILRPKFSPEKMQVITTAAAVAAAKSIEAVSGESTYIKWVNDIYMRGKKVAGILTESALDLNGGVSFAVMGIGINVFIPENGFEETISDIAGAVFEGSPDENMRELLINKFLSEFEEIYETLPDKKYIEEYRKRSFLIGKNISFLKGENEIKAEVLGIDDDFHLTVKKTDGEIMTLSTGEVSIKKDENFYKAF